MVALLNIFIDLSVEFKCALLNFALVLELSKLTSSLVFLESVVMIRDGIFFNILGDANNNIHEAKVKPLLNSSLSDPLWLDFNEICITPHENGHQLDLLGYNNEPVMLIKHVNSSIESFYLLKFAPHLKVEDIQYGNDQKALIEAIVALWLSSDVNDGITPSDSYEKYFQICKNQLVELNHLDHELTKTKSELNNYYVELFTYFVKDLIPPLKKISTDDSTIEYLKNLNRPFSDLEKMVREVFETASELNPASPLVILKKSYFVTEKVANKFNIPDTTESNSQILKAKGVSTQPKTTVVKPLARAYSDDNSLSKTIRLLDRYENAVKILLEKKIPVMGKNIASTCDPVISPPALTDSINKHKERILKCFRTYPEKWTLLKNNYLPLTKLQKI